MFDSCVTLTVPNNWNGNYHWGEYFDYYLSLVLEKGGQTLYYIIPFFKNSQRDGFWKHSGKRENAGMVFNIVFNIISII